MWLSPLEMSQIEQQTMRDWKWLFSVYFFLNYKPLNIRILFMSLHFSLISCAHCTIVSFIRKNSFNHLKLTKNSVIFTFSSLTWEAKNIHKIIKILEFIQCFPLTLTFYDILYKVGTAKFYFFVCGISQHFEIILTSCKNSLFRTTGEFSPWLEFKVLWVDNVSFVIRLVVLNS